MGKFHVVYFGSNDVPVDLIKPILAEIDADMTIRRPTNDAEVVEMGEGRRRHHHARLGAAVARDHRAAQAHQSRLPHRRRRRSHGSQSGERSRSDHLQRGGLQFHRSRRAGRSALLIAISRKLMRMNQYVRDGKWRRHTAELHAYRGRVYRIQGRTMGIVGLGHVGKQVAPRAQGMRLNVQTYDPYLAPKTAEDMGVKMVSFDELVASSDFISVHAPLTKQTRHMFGAPQFKAMKKTAYLINCARGGLVDSDALYDALVAGELAGAALDVTEPEPLPADHKLLTLPNVIVTCHTAANSDESYIDCQTHAASEVANVLSGKGPTTEIKDPWLLAEAQEEGFGGV